MKTSYHERDYAFGQSILTLRTAMGLTQDGLAKHLGISRRTVGDWEAGNSYPKVQHLKALIALGVRQQAFTKGLEEEEIRALWKASCQNVPLDEYWLSSLLEPLRSPHLHPVPKSIEESMESRMVVGGQMGRDRAPSPSGQNPQHVSPALGPRVDWGDALDVSTFYGREEERALLTQWVVQEHCHVVSLLGMGGIGKSALAVKLMYQVASRFEVVIFRSLRDAPALEELLNDCLQVLSPESLGQGEQAQGTVPTERYISLMLSHCSKKRILLVLDNLEGLLKEEDIRGHFRPGFESYGLLLNRVAETNHQSCLLLTSREKPAVLRHLENKYPQVRTLRLAGLDTAACQQLFMEKEVVGTFAEQEQLIEAYTGNPLALKVVGETIVDLFGGDIGTFLTGGTVIFGSVTDLLEVHFVRLSPLEQNVLCWLAIARELMAIDELLAVLVEPLPRIQVFEAIDSLRRRSLIEPAQRPGSFTLQSVVLEYVTALLIAEGSQEIQQGQLQRLIQYGLTQATAREYVRLAQERLLLSPLLAQLRGVYWEQARMERQLLGLLDELRAMDDSAQGYGPANLIALLRLLRGNLNSLDLSKLCIRGAYLQGTEMQETSVAFSLIRDTVWTEAVSAIRSVAISQDGRFWAAGGTQGEVRVWEKGGRSLHLYFQAHTGLVVVLTFSPNGRMLASGSLDGTVKLWNMEAETVGMAGAHNPSSSRGTLLWMGWSDCPQFLAFSPDGGMLASSGQSVTVRVFDTKTGTSLQNLRHPARAFGIAWSPDGKQLASTCFDGQLRLWERLSTLPSTCTEILRFLTSWETGPVYSLAFSPDGRTLVTTNWDRRIKLWEVGNGRLLHTFEGEMDRRNDMVVWSPDGRRLASSGYKKAIRVFDVEERRIRLTLHGHTSNINDLAFTPDCHSLLSAGTDGTLWVWDVETARCMRVMEGYALSLYSIDWSPDGTHLVSGGTGGYVFIWERSGEMPPRDLRGHRWVVRGVGWSPDGRFVASSGWEGDIYLWDPASLTCVQNIRHPQIGFEGLAWSPDGSFLAVGTFLEGLHVWDVREGRCCFVLEPGQGAFHSVAWSPDGSLLAGSSDDGSVYLWESTHGTRQHKLLGHHGNVISLAWSPDGRYLASGSGNRGSGELFLWDMCNLEADREIIGTGKGQATFSTAPVRPFDSPYLLRPFEGHPDLVCAVAWSPRGDQLISGCADGVLRWWDVQTGVCVNTRNEHQLAIRAIKVNPDGKLLASCGDDGTIRIWDVESGKHLQMLRRDRPYERLNITGIKGLTEAEITSMRALGAIEEHAP